MGNVDGAAASALADCAVLSNEGRANCLRVSSYITADLRQGPTCLVEAGCFPGLCGVEASSSRDAASCQVRGDSGAVDAELFGESGHGCPGPILSHEIVDLSVVQKSLNHPN